MMCARCDKPIPEGEAERLPVHGGSGAGGEALVHRLLCRRPPASPVSFQAERS
ncbi:hypothetical protein ACFUCT_25010 [Streptomyces parvus]|uniref:hypothetical protein n=1 Tax=Streptomyces parvus TaxID=66428 RepID=UPI00362F3F18